MTDSTPTATPIAEGLVARAARALGYVVTGDAGGWFGPLAPMKPQAPAEIAGRQFDFPSGYNLVTRPRAYEGTGFAELRALADSYDLIRLVIETRKDQIERLSWSIRSRAQGGPKSDPRIGAITTLFACPDGVHSWPSWLRLVLEDLLVIDAPSLYLRRSRDGKLCALEPLDGATIKRVIDDWGRTPQPPEPAYQQVLKGLPAVDYTTDELLYLPRNPRVHKVYGFSPVEQVQMTVNVALRRQIWTLQYYTEGNIPEALIGVPDAWTPDQIRQFQFYWDSLHEGNTAQRRHAKFVPGGVAKTFIPTREPALKDPFDEWLARVVCYAFSVSPQPFVQQLNRATAETAQDASLAEGLLPLKNWVKQLCDRVIAREFAAPDLEFAWSDEAPSDPAKVAAVAVDYVKAGIKSVNEVRAELGLDPVPDGDHPVSLAPPTREPLARFNPNHYGPGPQGGQFAPADEGSDDGAAAPKPAKPTQVAGGAEDDTGARGGMEGEFIDPEAPVRLALFQNAQAKLSALDPGNLQARQILVGPDWTPKPDEINTIQSELDRVIINRAADAAKHAYEKHVIEQGEFREIHSQVELQLLAQRVIRNNTPALGPNSQAIFYESSTNTLVIINTVDPAQSTIFRPTRKPYP